MSRSTLLRAVGVATLLGGLLAGAGSALAHGGQAETFTATFKDAADVFPEVNPCSGAPGTVSTVENGVFHVTLHPDGHFHVTGTFTGDFVFTPDDPAEPTFEGKSTFWFGENHNPDRANATFTARMNGTGSDGSSLKANVVAHITAAEFDFETDPPTIVDPVVVFEKFRCH